MKNLIKNIVIAVLVAWIAFLLLTPGSLAQLVIPMLIVVLGTVLSYAAHQGGKDHE